MKLHTKQPSVRRLLAATTILAALALPATASAQAGAEWTQSGGVPQGTRFSSLTDITTSNAGTLTEEFSYPTGVIGAHEGGPLVVNNVMYVVTPWPNNLIALDLTRPGKALWTYAPPDSATAKGHNFVANRGAAYADGLVVYTELDGHVDAVNAATGQAAWRVKVTDPDKDSETLPAAPIIVHGKVIIGDSLSEMGARGSVRALDLKTGKLIWQAYATGPDSDVLIDKSFHPYYAKDQGKDLGATTWPGTLWKHGGSTSWEWFTYDPELNLLYYGTSQPGTFNPTQRPGDNKWGASIFARNPDTGKAVWAYQLTPHDNWDYDATNEDTVVDLPINGVTTKVIVHFSKNGYVYVIDRAVGKLLSATPYADGLNWARKVDLSTGMPDVAPAMRTHQGEITSNICPSAVGGKDWQYSSYSPVTGLFYVGMDMECMSYQPILTMYVPRTPFTGIGNLGVVPSPNANGNLGAVVAWDPVHAKAVWSVPEAQSLQGPGTLVTAGNVVFYGTLDNHFKALDATNGNLLWQTTLECPIVSNPISYSGPDGKQRVAVYTGAAGCPAGNEWGEAKVHQVRASGGSMYQNFLPKAPPNKVKSGYVHVFKLP